MLFRGKGVDADAPGSQFPGSDIPVNLRRDVVELAHELAAVFHQIPGAEGLDRK